MSMQNYSQVKSASAPSDVLTAWQVSGGTLEALAELDRRAAHDARSSQGGIFGDDGLQAMMNTALASCGAESGLQANRPTTAYPFCADDGLQATMNTALASCLGDGLRASV